MDVTIDHARLLGALTTAAAVAERKTAKEGISNCVLLHADPLKGLKICATDLIVSSTEELDTRVDTTIAAPGKALINARYLFDVVKAMPPGPIALRGADNHWLHIGAKRVSFKLMGLNPQDALEIPQPERKTKLVTTPAGALIDMIERVYSSISTEDARVNLNGMLLESNGLMITGVSTDGHRLSKFSMQVLCPNFERSRGIIVPRRGVQELKSLIVHRKASEVEMGIDAMACWLFVRHNNLTLSVKLNNVVFPPYEQVIPSEWKSEVRVDRVDLIMMLERALVMAPQKTATVRLAFGSRTLEMHTDNPDLGVINDSIDLEGHKGDPLVAGFNANYMLDALKASSTKQVAFRLKGELDPLTIRPVDGADFTSVVMPMRI